MSHLIVTVDIDWACEPAIEETLDFLKDKNILPTIFSTHHSSRVEASMSEIEIGLHPYFDLNSSQGSCITEVVKYVMDLPHNLPAYRCHRFASCNVSRQAMAEAGLLISSNVCTDLEIISPFKDRFGLLEVPIFLEDGGYLWQKHPLEIKQPLMEKIVSNEIKVITIHPMHFAINTPHFHYMQDIKKSVNRQSWSTMRKKTLNNLRWPGRGIRDLMIDLLQCSPQTSSLGVLLAPS